MAHASNRIVFVNSKGGVGKSTSAVNTAVALAEMNKRVLLVDMDAQSHVAQHLGIDVSASQSVDAVLQQRNASLDGAICESAYPNLFIAPSTNQLEAVEKVLMMRNQPLDGLWKALRGVRGFELVLIDCAPSLGVLTKNAMRASDHLVITTNLDSFSVSGMSRLGETIQEFAEDYDGRCARVLGVLITMYDRRNGVANRTNYDNLYEAFGGDEVFFERRIRTDQRCNDAKRAGRSVLDIKSSRAAEDYRAFAAEMISRLPG